LFHLYPEFCLFHERQKILTLVDTIYILSAGNVLIQDLRAGFASWDPILDSHEARFNYFLTCHVVYQGFDELSQKAVMQRYVGNGGWWVVGGLAQVELRLSRTWLQISFNFLHPRKG
jgi:hypothetical protein